MNVGIIPIVWVLVGGFIGTWILITTTDDGTPKH
jgi:hypothetical protein